MSGRLKIYPSKKHLVITFLFIVMPFVFLLFFSRFANIDAKTMFKDFFISLWRLLVAYIIAAFIGWLFAVFFYHGRPSKIALPLFDVLQSFPTFAALPIATLFWGVSNLTVIVFLVMTIIWPIFFSIISSLKLIRKDWQESAQIYQLSGFNYFKFFLLPISIPGLVTGSIIGLGEGWEALVATEIIVGINSGLGQFFDSFSNNVVITTLGIFGLLLLIFSINKIIWLPLLDWSHEMMED
jgi:ABC-type nitrate/sulfonate/bicarbonate transport system permease component